MHLSCATEAIVAPAKIDDESNHAEHGRYGHREQAAACAIAVSGVARCRDRQKLGSEAIELVRRRTLEGRLRTGLVDGFRIERPLQFGVRRRPVSGRPRARRAWSTIRPLWLSFGGAATREKPVAVATN